MFAFHNGVFNICRAGNYVAGGCISSKRRLIRKFITIIMCLFEQWIQQSDFTFLVYQHHSSELNERHEVIDAEIWLRIGVQRNRLIWTWRFSIKLNRLNYGRKWKQHTVAHTYTSLENTILLSILLFLFLSLPPTLVRSLKMWRTKHDGIYFQDEYKLCGNL